MLPNAPVWDGMPLTMMLFPEIAALKPAGRFVTERALYGPDPPLIGIVAEKDTLAIALILLRLPRAGAALTVRLYAPLIVAPVLSCAVTLSVNAPVWPVVPLKVMA